MPSTHNLDPQSNILSLPITIFYWCIPVPQGPLSFIRAFLDRCRVTPYIHMAIAHLSYGSQNLVLELHWRVGWRSWGSRAPGRTQSSWDGDIEWETPPPRDEAWIFRRRYCFSPAGIRLVDPQHSTQAETWAELEQQHRMANRPVSDRPTDTSAFPQMGPLAEPGWRSEAERGQP